MYMVTIGDDASPQIVDIQGGTYRAGLSRCQWAHSVEQVGDALQAKLCRRGDFFVAGTGVAGADQDAAAGELSDMLD